MKKKLLTAAVLGALTLTAHAQGSVTLYGFIDTGLVSATHVFDKTTGMSGSVLKMDDGISWGTSRWGLRGKEDLGGGLSAIYDLESGFHIPNGQLAGSALFNRGSYVGLQGNLGTVTLGRQWNLSDDNMIGSFFRGGFNLSVFRLTGFDEASDLIDNAVKYKTPDLSGFQASGLYSFGGVAGSWAAKQVYEAAATYGNGPLKLGAVYHHRNDAIAPFSSQLWSLGASYSFGPARLRLWYGNSKYPNPAGPSLRAAIYNAGVDYQASGSLLLSADAIYRKQSGTSDSAQMARLTADYSLSKRTGIFANLGFIKNRHNSAEALYGDGQVGQSQTVVNLGMRHAF